MQLNLYKSETSRKYNNLSTDFEILKGKKSFYLFSHMRFAKKTDCKLRGEY